MSSSYQPTTGSGGPAAASADASNPFSVQAPFDVYTHKTVTENTFAPGEQRRYTTPTRVTQNATDYMRSQLQGKTPEQLKQLQQQLADAGYSVTPTGLLDADTITAYEKLLTDVHMANTTGNDITPDDYLAQKAAANGGPNGAGSHTTTSVNYTDPTDARAAALSAFQQALGKRPNQHQIDAFYQALHVYETAHPSVTTSDTTGNNTTSTTSGGTASPDAFAQQYVDSHFGGQVGANDALHYFSLIANTLSGPPGAHSVV